jgi:hypothetical protein
VLDLPGSAAARVSRGVARVRQGVKLRLDDPRQEVAALGEAPDKRSRGARVALATDRRDPAQVIVTLGRARHHERGRDGLDDDRDGEAERGTIRVGVWRGREPSETFRSLS